MHTFNIRIVSRLVFCNYLVLFSLKLISEAQVQDQSLAPFKFKETPQEVQG